jgi:hypothetical protein
MQAERSEEGESMIEFLQQLWWLWLLALAVAAWIKFAKHPTARGLRVAIGDTLAL